MKIVRLMENDLTATQDRAQLTIFSIRMIQEVEVAGVDTQITEIHGEVTITVGGEAAT